MELEKVFVSPRLVGQISDLLEVEVSTIRTGLERLREENKNWKPEFAEIMINKRIN